MIEKRRAGTASLVKGRGTATAVEGLSFSAALEMHTAKGIFSLCRIVLIMCEFDKTGENICNFGRVDSKKR